MGADAPRKRPFTIDDAMGFRVVADAQISPDGLLVAFVIADPFRARGSGLPKSEIQLVRIEGGPVTPLSPPAADHQSHPRWSPDGRRLAFLSDRGSPGRLALWLWQRDGRGIAPVGTQGVEDTGPHTASVAAPEWSPDGRSIAFLVRDPAPAPREAGLLDAANDVLDSAAPPTYQRLWVVDVETGSSTCITGGLDAQIWEASRSPDGRQFAMILSERPEERAWYRSRLATIDGTGANVRALLDGTTLGPGAVDPLGRRVGRQLAHPRWSPDGRWISCVGCTWSDRGIVGGDLYVLPSTGGSARNLTEGLPVSVSWTHWISDRRILVAGWHDGEQVLTAVDPVTGSVDSGWRARAALADRAQPRFSVAAEGTIAAVREDPSNPREVWVVPERAVSASSPWQQLTRVQPGTQHLDLATCETIHWRGRDARPIQGHLLRRHAATAGPSPLVVFPHGGPVFLHQYLFHGWVEGPYALPFQLLAAAGIAVLLPNPRGSLGWGADFVEAILGEHGSEDLYDVLNGVNHCVDRGIADPERLGIAGWSSAGLLAALATCRTHRFRAAVVGAGKVNPRAMCHVHPDFDRLFYGGSPFRLDTRYDRCTALTDVANVRTPTLIVHGQNDALLPMAQAECWHTALVEHGVPTQLVVYPGEAHAIREYHHQRDLAVRIVRWFERWLLTQPA